jgi:hypothetical protein
VKALGDQAAVVGEEVGVRSLLDALGHDVAATGVGEAQDRGIDRGGLRVAGNAGQEGAVDLDDLHRQLAQPPQRGVARAEVVDREREAGGAQLPEHRQQPRGLQRPGALRDLEHQAAGRDAVSPRECGEAPGDVATAQLARRHVDPDVRVHAGRVPLADVAADLAQHPVAERLDHARPLGDRDEVGGRDELAAHRVAPAHQGLDADHRAIGQPHDGLVVDLELLALDRPPQPGGRLESCDGVAGGGAEQVDSPTRGLRLVHRRIGVLAHRLRRLAVVREHGDADADVDEQLGRAERERRLHGVGDPLAHGLGRGAVARRQVADEDEELVAALPGDEVAGPHGGAQAVGHLAQQIVAEIVPERIVDALEVVEVGERERARAARRPRGIDGLVERGLEGGAVRQPGERVVVGEEGHHLPARRHGCARRRHPLSLRIGR